MTYIYGDQILIKGQPDLLKPQSNPYAFTFTKYMQRRGFYLHDFLYEDEIIRVSHNPRYPIKHISILVGNAFNQTRSQHISAERELTMIRAMVLGRRNEIRSEMEYVYQATGTSHILAVSGLHVGILFLIFSTILKSMKRKWFRWIYYTIVLRVIWSFAFVTGGSASVFRASLMVSIVLIAEILSRKSSIYNSILVSAFFSYCLILTCFFCLIPALQCGGFWHHLSIQ